MTEMKTVSFYVEEHPITGEDIEDCEFTFAFPATFVVCYDCRGTGKTYLGWASKDQPAFTEEDFAYEGPEFVEDYFGGNYDKQCPECKGQRVVLEIVEKFFNKEQKAFYKLYKEHLQDEYDSWAESEAERRMGC